MNHGGSQRDLQGAREHVLGVSLMLHPDAIPPKTRRHLSFDSLIRQIRLRAKQLPETRDKSDCQYSMADAVMSAIAMFSLKDPSLLAFQERRNDENIKNLFRVLNVSSDTQMRVILDPLEPDLLRPMFNSKHGVGGNIVFRSFPQMSCAERSATRERSRIERIPALKPKTFVEVAATATDVPQLVRERSRPWEDRS